MSTCQSCGGVIGRDCFNPDECMAITRSMADQQQHDSQELHYLRHRVAELEAAVAPPCADTDWLSVWAGVECAVVVSEWLISEETPNRYPAVAVKVGNAFECFCAFRKYPSLPLGGLWECVTEEAARAFAARHSIPLSPPTVSP